MVSPLLESVYTVLLYEVLSLCTLPLVIHNEGAKDWDGAQVSALSGGRIEQHTSGLTSDLHRTLISPRLMFRNNAMTFGRLTLLTVMISCFKMALPCRAPMHTGDGGAHAGKRSAPRR
jgi:hypothetical protein